MAEQLLTFHETASRLHLSLLSIRREVDLGNFEVISVGPTGRAKRIPESSVDAYITKRAGNGKSHKSTDTEETGSLPSKAAV